MNAVGEEMVRIDTSFADSTFFDRTIRAYGADSSFQKAAEAAGHATAKFPKNVYFLNFRYGLERRAGQTQQSIVTIRRIMELDPKALPAAHGAIANAYIDLNQPDSALAELRAGIAANEDKTVMAAGILKIANARQTALGQDATRKEDVGEWRKIYALMSFADTISAAQANAQIKVQAKFLKGVSEFQVGYLTLKDNATGAKSCDVTHEAQKFLLQAVSDIPAGGSFAAAAAGQYMGILNDLLPNADQQAKVFCKPKDATKKP
jgi:tetratricopeptide (TPR) repeat protein